MKKGDIVRVIQSLKYVESEERYEHSWDAEIIWIDPKINKGCFADVNSKRSQVLAYGEGKNTKLTLLIESAPSFQSTVSGLSDDKLKESIHELRMARAHVKLVPRRKSKAPAEPKIKMTPIEKMLNAMPADKREALKKKLGMID